MICEEIAILGQSTYTQTIDAATYTVLSRQLEDMLPLSEIDITVSCQATSPYVFSLTASLGEIAQSFAPCPISNISGNITASLPVPNSASSTLLLKVNSVHASVWPTFEQLTISSVIVENCLEPTAPLAWWVYLLFVALGFVGVYAIYMFIRNCLVVKYSSPLDDPAVRQEIINIERWRQYDLERCNN